MLVLTVLAVARSNAYAADSAAEARARVFYENGVQLYEEGLYEQAILAFQEAYALTERAPLLYNIASCYERLERWQEAIDTLNTYRVYAKAEDREKLEQRIDELERRRAEAEAARLAEPEPPPVEPPPADPPTEPPATPETDTDRRIAPWVLVGAGGAAGLGFGTVATVTFIQSRPFIEAGDQASWEALRPLNNRSFVGAMVGGGIALTGLIWALLPPATPASAVSVGPGTIQVRF